MNHYKRRATENKVGDIEALIAEENDPKQRAFLIILNSINASMIANTGATLDVAEKLDNHLSAFEAKVEADAQLLNQGRGAWRVLAWVLGSAQLVILAVAGYAFSDLQKIHQELTSGAVTDARIEARITALEKRP
jgi:hypothetical protein